MIYLYFVLLLDDRLLYKWTLLVCICATDTIYLYLKILEINHIYPRPSARSIIVFTSIALWTLYTVKTPSIRQLIVVEK